MKQVLLLALAAVSVARLGVAGTCMGGTLASYIALGAGGCTIGSSTLSNFEVLSGIGGATEFKASSVSLTPSGGGFSPSLTLSVTGMAAPGVLLETMFTYEISGQAYIANSVLLFGSSETVDGGVTGLENYCAGGSFGPDGVDGCTGATGALVTLDGIQNTDKGIFSKVKFVNVTNDFTLDGGIAGSASGGKFTDTFAAVPEPAALALAGFGLLLAAAYRKRSK